MLKSLQAPEPVERHGGDARDGAAWAQVSARLRAIRPALAAAHTRREDGSLAFTPAALDADQAALVAELVELAALCAPQDAPLDEAASPPQATFEALIAELAADRLSQGNVQTVVELADLLEQRERFAANDWLMERLLTRDPGFYWPHFVRGRVRLNRGEARAAIEPLGRAIARNPDFAWAHVLKYRAHLACDQRAEAIEHLNQAFRIMPELRQHIAIEQIQSLSRFTWTVEHEAALSHAVALGPLPEPALDAATATALNLLADRRLRPQAARDCAVFLGRVFASPARPTEFHVAPLLYVAALIAAEDDYEGAVQLLSQFEHLLPQHIDASAGERFLNAIQSATEIYIKSIYLNGWTGAARPKSVCLLLAELQHQRFRNSSLARMLAEAAHAQAGANRDASSELLRLLTYRDENKWFEVLNLLLARTDAEIAELPLCVRILASALAAVTEGSPALALAATRQLCALAAKSAHPSETMEAIVDDARLMLRRAAAQFYERMKSAAVNGDPGALPAWEHGHEQFCDAIEACEALLHAGPPREPNASGEILILVSPYLPQVLHYRGEQLSEMFETVGVSAPLIDLTQTPVEQLQLRAAAARFVVIQRQPATFEIVRFMAWCRRVGVPLYYDIDDQIFDARISPLPLADYAGRIDRATHVHLQFDCSLFRQAIARADAVIVSTEPLRQQIEALGITKPIYLRRNMVGEPLRSARLDARRERAARTGGARDTVEIFYGSATKAHKSYFDEVVLPALIATARARPRARFALIGDFRLAGLPADIEDRFSCETRTLDYPQYLARLAQADVSIAPLNLNPVTDVKSELKWLEAACLGVASVLSPTANTRDALGAAHALYADAAEEWTDALTRLIDEPELRESLVRESEKLIAANYEISAQAEPFFRALAPAAPRRAQRRLLAVNTYFRPQSIGGATRIADSYAVDLARRYGDRFEVIALCADEKNRGAAPYSVTVLRQDGVTVLRCAVPPRDWADPFDARIEALASQLARDFEIDVVHAHSVQILTASVVEGFLKAGVPVLLSLHDGWWLSEHQFLVDEDGKAFLPRPDGGEIAETQCRRMTTSARLRRRAQLARVMQKCARRLAVSESFADVYRRAGIAGIEVMENGVELKAARVLRPLRADDAPLRIGFIGGMSAHKGLRLLEGVVRSERLDRLEFVLVDHRFEHGYERESRWGASRVTVIGKAPQTRVAEVYARIDVLAAPSIWPESFGLVAREARAHGVAVIASRRGDIGRGIQPGRDGWLIDVADDSDLRALLRRLNAEPAAGRLTPSRPAARNVEAAVDQLVGLVDETLA